MKTIQFAQDIPLASFDIIIIGGGPAGCGAALAAARRGARVLLIESSNCLGGNMTIALVTVWRRWRTVGLIPSSSTAGWRWRS